MITVLLQALKSGGTLVKFVKLLTTLLPLLGPIAQGSAGFMTGRALRPVLQTAMALEVLLPLIGFIVGIALSTAEKTDKAPTKNDLGRAVQTLLF